MKQMKQGGILSPILLCFIWINYCTNLKFQMLDAMLAICLLDGLGMLTTYVCEYFCKTYDVVLTLARVILKSIMSEWSTWRWYRYVWMVKPKYSEGRKGVLVTQLVLVMLIIFPYTTPLEIVFGKLIKPSQNLVFIQLMSVPLSIARIVSAQNGSPLWQLDSNELKHLHVKWRNCIRKIWNIPVEEIAAF